MAHSGSNKYHNYQVFNTTDMVREKDVDKLGASGLFKNNLSFELRVRQHCQSKGKSAVQLVNGRGIIHLICLQQMREIRKVRLQNKGIPKEDRVKPTKKCSASFRAVKRKGFCGCPSSKNRYMSIRRRPILAGHHVL